MATTKRNTTGKKKAPNSLKQTKRQKLLPFHDAFESLTYLGTLWRTAFCFALLLALSVISLIYFAIRSSSTIDIGQYLSGMELSSSFGLLLVVTVLLGAYDALFVTIARRYSYHARVDKILLLGLELILAVMLFVDAVFYQFAAGYAGVSYDAIKFFGVAYEQVLFWVLVAALLLPFARMFVGVSESVNRKR